MGSSILRFIFSGHTDPTTLHQSITKFYSHGDALFPKSPFMHLLYITDVTSSLALMNSRDDGASRASLDILFLAQESLPNSPSKPAHFQLKAIPTCLIPTCLWKTLLLVLKNRIKVTPEPSLLQAQQSQFSQSSLIYLFLS